MRHLFKNRHGASERDNAHQSDECLTQPPLAPWKSADVRCITKSFLAGDANIWDELLRHVDHVRKENEYDETVDQTCHYVPAQNPFFYWVQAMHLVLINVHLLRARAAFANKDA